MATSDPAAAAVKRQCRSKSCLRARKRRRRQLTDDTCGSKSRYCDAKETILEKYHYHLGWLSEREHAIFCSTLRRPLPVCFRIRQSGCGAVAKDFQDLVLQEKIQHQVKQLPGNSWQLPSDTVFSCPKIRQWLTKNTLAGTLSRQEFVSMIPVLLLGIQSHHRVLDLCASPGSKTIQAVDALYDDHATSLEERGFIMANERDPSRAYVLAHRCKETLAERMTSVAIVNHDACKLPNMLAPLQKADSPAKERPFDRVICDVPCSGDGTCRKDTKAWKNWHPSYGIELHSLQVRIAKRGIALMEIGGLMTYSTCSFHPIENEAVVTALLETGCVELIPCDTVRVLKGVRRRPGLTHWKVLDDNCQEVQESERPGWSKSLWPSHDPSKHRVLQRCIRMVPQDNDTGGFFIALLRKVKDFPCGNKRYTYRAKTAPVTPQAEHHKLFSASTSGNIFTRGPSGGGQHFQLSDRLSHYLTESQGSVKVNIVYTGKSIPHRVVFERPTSICLVLHQTGIATWPTLLLSV